MSDTARLIEQHEARERVRFKLEHEQKWPVSVALSREDGKTILASLGAADALTAAEQELATLVLREMRLCDDFQAECDRLAAELAEAKKQTEIFRLGAEIGGEVLYERWQAAAAELAEARAALEIADREASIAHDAIWHDDVKGIGGTGFGVLHDNDRPDSAQSAIWRLHNAVRPAMAAGSGRQQETQP